MEKVMEETSAVVLAMPRRTFRQALRYWFPRRLTLRSNPRVHAWLWWNFVALLLLTGSAVAQKNNDIEVSGPRWKGAFTANHYARVEVEPLKHTRVHVDSKGTGGVLVTNKRNSEKANVRHSRGATTGRVETKRVQLYGRYSRGRLRGNYNVNVGPFRIRGIRR